MRYTDIFRVGGVVLLLLSPVLLYLFLHTFGENHYDLPIYLEQKPSQHRSLSEIPCVTHSYPYKVFDHPSGRSLHKADAALYLIHNLSDEQSIERLSTLYEQTRARSRVAFYGILEQGHSFSLPTYDDWMFKTLTPDGAAYLRDCVLHVMDLFEQDTLPQDWAILLDAKGRIRGFFNPSSDTDFKKGRSEAFIIQDLMSTSSNS